MRGLLSIVALVVAVFVVGFASTAEPELLDVLERVESPPPSQEAMLAFPTSFTLVSFDGAPIEIDGADGRWWSVGAWAERDGRLAYALYMYNADEFGRSRGGSCPVYGLLRATDDGRLGYLMGVPNAEGLDLPAEECLGEPTLIAAEDALFAEHVTVRVTGSGFVLESPNGDAVFKRATVRGTAFRPSGGGE